MKELAGGFLVGVLAGFAAGFLLGQGTKQGLGAATTTNYSGGVLTVSVDTIAALKAGAGNVLGNFTG